MAPRLWLAAWWLGAFPAAALAAGYGIYEQGAAVMGRAGAGTASVRDASAVFYNPAALVHVPGMELTAGASLLQTRTEFEGAPPDPGAGVAEAMEPGTFGLPMLYLTRQYASGLAVGIGINTPYGLGVAWEDPATFTGRERVTEASLQTVQGSVVAAYPMSEVFSLGIGVDVIAADVRLERYQRGPVAFGRPNVATIELESDWGTGVGWNAALAMASEDLPFSVGLTWRAAVDVDLDGDADFTQIPTGIAPLDAGVAATLPSDQGVRTTIHLPAIGAFGIACHDERWLLEATAVFTQWSVFTDLPLDFDTDSLDTRIVEDYDDTWAFRFGGERRFERTTLRAGYYYETAAAPVESVTPLLPDAARHGVTLGVGFVLGADRRLRLDVYDLALFPETRSTDGRSRDGYQGTYDSYVNALGATVSWRW